MNTEDFIPKLAQNSIKKATHSYQAPSNIALVKYWGKTDLQIPKNASISFTLKNCKTITSIQFTKQNKERIFFDLFFNGEKKESFNPKIQQFLERIEKFCPYLLEYHLKIETTNTFPHSSGIASSASAMAAIAMCLVSFEKELYLKSSDNFYIKKASFLARLGSGSACRSIEGPIVSWGKHPKIKENSDLFGTKFTKKIHPIFQNYQDTILLVDKKKKKISSSVGHNLMHKHPFAESRFDQANKNITKIHTVLQEGNITEFIKITESEALTLHAMMLTSNPYFILMQPNTLQIINEIWNFRNTTNSKLCSTLDAGANVHVLYPEDEKTIILQFIEEKLSPYCQNRQFIIDSVGLGASKMGTI